MDTAHKVDTSEQQEQLVRGSADKVRVSAGHNRGRHNRCRSRTDINYKPPSEVESS